MTEIRAADWNSHGVVAFEFLGRSGRFVQGLNGQDTVTGATTLYSRSI